MSSSVDNLGHLTFYNSFYREKQLFTPIKSGEVAIYSCGPTVYDFPHIGNYRSFLFSDLLHRVLKLFGYKVTFVMNLTDIDDKTIKGSQAKKQSLKEYTQPYIEAFFEDLKSLNVLPADHYPRATEHIAVIEMMIDQLLEKGHAYYSDGSIYFRLASFSEYGKLSNIKLEEQLAGASNRVLSDEYEKDEVSDFVLWKKYAEEDGAVYFDSHLGKGRPGWHIECSAMSKKYLGEHFDLHTGGIDNRFPHHENEIAQSVCAHNHDYVNYWMHASHLLVDNQKMSKSLGNFYTLRDLIDKGMQPNVLRYMLLSNHYRNHYNFILDNHDSAVKAIERVERFAHTLQKAQKEKTQEEKNTTTPSDGISTNPEIDRAIEERRQVFLAALQDDLNVSLSLASVFELLSDIYRLTDNFSDDPSDNQVISVEQIRKILNFLEEVNSVFACFNFSVVETKQSFPPEVLAVFEKRNLARESKDFALADELRDQLAKLGYKIIDGNKKDQHASSRLEKITPNIANNT